ncbi:uncharacterized protein [Montipora capricornis]|uniref:uncharacterized protein isoform X1 n=1 Tax=Montipora capricornis TaxID=246305 RepID=UPI0035F11C7D
MYTRTLKDNRTMSLKVIVVFLLLGSIGIALSKYVENENEQAYLRRSRFSNKETADKRTHILERNTLKELGGPMKLSGKRKDENEKISFVTGKGISDCLKCVVEKCGEAALECELIPEPEIIACLLEKCAIYVIECIGVCLRN